MEIARGLLAGNWDRGVNGYWSPLYPFVISLFMRLFRDDPVGHFAAARTVNFLILIFAVVVFERLLRQIAGRWVRPESADEKKEGRPFVLASYAVFAWACFDLNMVARISPDLWVLVMLMQTVNLLFGLESRSSSAWRFLRFGAALGIGYWVKAILFPVGILILLSAALTPAFRGRRKMLLWSGIGYAIVAAPLVVAMSIHCGHVTFGDAGRLNYVWYVNRVPHDLHWQGGPAGQGEPEHTTRKIHSDPDVFEFATPIDACYPPWAEPSYWYAGVKPQFDVRRQVFVLAKNLYFLSICIGKNPFVPIVILAGWLIGRRNTVGVTPIGSSARLRDFWPLWLTGFVPIAVYLPVYLEPRHVGGSILLVFLGLVGDTRIRNGRTAGWYGVIALLAATATIAPRQYATAVRVLIGHGNVHDDRWKVAEEFARLGLSPRTPVASIGNVAFDDWAYPAQVRVVTEIVSFNQGKETDDVDRFWRASPEERRSILSVMRRAGARIVVSNRVPDWAATDGWTHIPDSPYYWYDLIRLDS
jgi:hypothetical protein